MSDLWHKHDKGHDCPVCVTHKWPTAESEVTLKDSYIMKTVPTETSKVKEIEIGILVEKYRADLLKEVQRGQADNELEQDWIKAEL